MSFTDRQISDRLILLKAKKWPVREISDWFGIGLSGDNHSILQQYLIWSEQDNMAAYTEPQTIDRCKFEIFLQTRQWMSKKSAALTLAVTEANFEQIMEAATQKHLVAKSESDGIFKGVYAAEFINGFYKRFASIRTTTFPNLEVFYARLHFLIKETLGVTVNSLTCQTSEILEDINYATSVDIITGEPMSQKYSVSFNTDKPLQLRPDACSFLTYIKHEEILKPALLGRSPVLTVEQIQKLRAYAAQN